MMSFGPIHHPNPALTHSLDPYFPQYPTLSLLVLHIEFSLGYPGRISSGLCPRAQ